MSLDYVYKLGKNLYFGFLRKQLFRLVNSKSLLQRVLRGQNIYPIKPVFNHTLESEDEIKRLDFCLWIGSKNMSNLNFYKSFIFFDEAF